MVNLRFLHLATAVQVITFVEMIHDYSLVLQRGVPGIVLLNNVQIFHPEGSGFGSGFVQSLPVVTPVQMLQIIDSLAEGEIWVEFLQIIHHERDAF